MFRTYLKIAWRNLWKSKVITGVNLLGMTVAFAAALLLGMTVFFENSYDAFHKNKSAIFQVYRSENTRQKVNEKANLPAALQPTMLAEMNNIKASTRFISTGGLVRYGDQQLSENIDLVDGDYFRMFTFPVVEGAHEPLQELNNMVLSQKIAKALFGRESPVGKTVQVNMGNGFEGYVVTAVVADPPANSSFDNALYLRFEKFVDYPVVKNLWGASVASQFVQLKDPSKTAAFLAGTQSIVQKYLKDFLVQDKKDGVKPSADGTYRRYGLIPLPEMHFNAISSMGAGVGHRYILLLMLITGFILFIAATNFVNITLARAFGRGREIGMRKVMGALRQQLVLQLWSEAFIQCSIALLLGLAVAALLLPAFNATFRANIHFSLLYTPRLLSSVLACFGIVTLLAGGYPAWRMARQNTLLVLKGKVAAGKNNGLRNILIVAQFVIAAALICCTLIAWQQVSYLRNQPLGYNKSEVISIPLETGSDPEKLIRLLRDRLSSQSQVRSISGADVNLGRGLDGGNSTSIMGFTYNDHSVQTHWMNVGYDYLSTLDLQLLAGRDFSRNHPTDVQEGLVINEAMARELGGVQTAIGVRLPLGVNDSLMTVIGVVKDFNYQSLKNNIDPLSITIRAPSYLNYIFVKVAPGHLPASMDLVKKAWIALEPGKPFQGSFLDENTERQYRQEGRLTSIFISSAVLAIVIACMGLFAIAVMAMSLRTREVGIRKVLGASVNSIVALLSGDFLKLVALAIVLAIPVSWWAMNQWLADYAYRIQIHIGVFVVAAFLGLGIAFLTISFNAVRTALANPVNSLRSE
ncbi:ABC-type antimicrobial peptide transport system, permease component [Chitinophaga costaii]|uniref:ABC-type antimicrobial peptide transport system, permease component n=1 Tax=Chitinophaga costaii TaxID=1335309 RepID=A0A1C4FQT3_9BACT|nr:ABC transporter permease [Chitinophaga costaii]PUZ20474.1 ABC transporter permease [Chitinophaga costaii]SCC58349.1 ABC-type antimicrobial peptide transport system, permease component [Chitinophaga costaii]